MLNIRKVFIVTSLFIINIFLLFKFSEPPKIQTRDFFPKRKPVEKVVTNQLYDFYKKKPASNFPEKAKIARVSKYSSRGNRRIMIITAYCSCEKCCGKSDGITASGTKAHWGTVAAPPDIPFGTKIIIEDLGVFTVEDRGGAIKGNRLDIWFPSHEKAIEFGVQKRKVVVGGKI